MKLSDIKLPEGYLSPETMAKQSGKDQFIRLLIPVYGEKTVSKSLLRKCERLFVTTFHKVEKDLSAEWVKTRTELFRVMLRRSRALKLRKTKQRKK